jgi:hypothetical protein|tara:strand:- start:240 stop:389 length:150 start_codon:yes stop_codon:yes gene_type:complete
MATVLGEIYLSCEQCGELQERDNSNDAPFKNGESEFYINDILIKQPRGK